MMCKQAWRTDGNTLRHFSPLTGSFRRPSLRFVAAMISFRIVQFQSFAKHDGQFRFLNFTSLPVSEEFSQTKNVHS